MRDQRSMTTSIKVEKAELKSEEWKNALLTLLPERSPYKVDENQLTIGTYTGRILGIPYDEFEYFMQFHKLASSPGIYLLSEKMKGAAIEGEHTGIQEVLDRSWEKAGLSGDRLVVFLDEEGWMPTLNHPAMHLHLQKAFAKTINIIKQNYPKGFANPDFHHLVADMVEWLNKFVQPWFERIDTGQEMPRIVWYGEASKSQIYFLYFLMLAGCDVLVFQPEGTDHLAEVDPQEKVSFVYTYPTALSRQPLRKNELQRLETVAYQSSRQLDIALRQEDAPIYKPWQFRDHLPQAVTLKTTYDELFLIAKEQAYIRPGFHAGRTKIEIPNLFAKISGVTQNRREYWRNIHILMESEQAHLIRYFPFTEEERVDYTIHYEDTLNREGNIDPERLKQSPIWLYKHLPPNRQSAMAHAISRMCAKPKLLPKESETIDDVRLYLFTQVTNLSEEGLRWFQGFDYAQAVPRLILYHNEKNGTFIRSDAAKLLLLNELGFDLFIFNPSGYSSIEDFIDPDAFDIHVLDEMAFDQKFKRPSVFKKMFTW